MGGTHHPQPRVQGRVEGKNVSIEHTLHWRCHFAVNNLFGFLHVCWGCGCCMHLPLHDMHAPKPAAGVVRLVWYAWCQECCFAVHYPPPPIQCSLLFTSSCCRIDNPKYKGIWVAPDIDNPDFKDDPKLYLQKDLKYIGFELWQVSQQHCKGARAMGARVGWL